jgi:hypothetical protein
MALKEQQSRNGIAKSMWHVSDIMMAMADKRTLVIVGDAITNVGEQVSGAKTIADIGSIVLRDTTVTYRLLSKQNQRFYSLDMHQHSNAIREIDDVTITHCHAHDEAPPRIGDVFAASVYGEAVHSDTVKFGSFSRTHAHLPHCTPEQSRIKWVPDAAESDCGELLRGIH